MIYSQEKQLLFIHVSRTGGTSVENCLRNVLADSEVLLGQHESLAAARPLFGDQFDRLFKFAFVRNPWDRFVSWFALIARATDTTDSPGARLADPDTPHWRGFDAFLEHWSTMTVQIDGVTRPLMSQWAQLTDAHGTLLTDDYGRFETLGVDLVRLLDHAGIRCSSRLTLNPSHHHHYSMYYSDFGREMVADICREDTERFGYCFKAVER